MKAFKLTLVVMAAVLITFGLGGTAAAFHGGGVAHCDGCHSMHGGGSNIDLMAGSDASSTCLNCHEGSPSSYHVSSTDPTAVNYTQGGDFSWLKKSWTSTNWSGTSTFYGQGHNIVAGDFGYTADPVKTTAPGGTYPAANLGCTSCHDAHGQVLGGTAGSGGAVSVSGSYGAEDPTDGSIHGNYRLLGDSAYSPGAVEEIYQFGEDAPVAKAKGSSGTKVDYGSGMSEWCTNCHTAAAGLVHPAGNGMHLDGLATNYNSYVATGDFTGTSATSYDALVPFERGIADGSLLDYDSTIGPDGASNVMCLTCHRAHASANENIGKWDFGAELLTESSLAGSDDSFGLDKNAGTYAAGAIIDIAATYGHSQRSPCNKCHVQD